MVPEIEQRTHDAVSIERDTPAACPGDLSDQRVSVEPTKGAAHLRAFFYGIVPAGPEMTRRCEPCPDVAVGETSQAVLAGHEGLE